MPYNITKNSTTNTALTDAIRSGIKQLGGDARLVRLTPKKNIKVLWKYGASGMKIPKSMTKTDKETFKKGFQLLLVRREDSLYYYLPDDNTWYTFDTASTGQLLKDSDVIDSIKAGSVTLYGEITMQNPKANEKKVLDLFKKEFGISASVLRSEPKRLGVSKDFGKGIVLEIKTPGSFDVPRLSSFEPKGSNNNLRIYEDAELSRPYSTSY